MQTAQAEPAELNTSLRALQSAQTQQADPSPPYGVIGLLAAAGVLETGYLTAVRAGTPGLDARVTAQRAL